MPKKTFESALSRLEQITAELEEGELSLEKSLKKFEEGIELVRFCSSRLEEARSRVDVLLEKSGHLETVPFDEKDRGDQTLS
ncbi:MAG TPA: exodeoxyribonuclease VII small subunit [Desulfobulbus sp.]|nr:exodeoxyribonuclease VII small subunit [Desulfobulbus sp.]